MSSRISILAAAVGATALIGATVGATAPAAGPDYVPQLVASPVGPSGFLLNLKFQTATQTATGRISLFAPQGSKAGLASTVGNVAGNVSARFALADQNDTIVNLKGSVVIVATAKLACAADPTASPTVSLVANLSGGGVTLAIPMAVYATTGSAAQLSPCVVTECLPAPGPPKGVLGRSPEGGRLVSETLTLPWFTAAANAVSYWVSDWTPYTAGTTTLDTAGSVSAQSATGAPRFLLHSSTTTTSSQKNGKPVTKTQATLTGKVTRGNLGVTAADVNVYYGASADRLVSTRWQTTDRSGRFSYQTQVSRPYQFFQAHAKVPGRIYPVALCRPAIVSDTCTGVSTAPMTMDSNVVKVRAR
jgi:hypothetical protein